MTTHQTQAVVLHENGDLELATLPVGLTGRVGELQEILGGPFAIVRLGVDALLWCNEEGLMRKMQHNFKASKIANTPVVGPAVITGLELDSGQLLDVPIDWLNATTALKQRESFHMIRVRTTDAAHVAIARMHEHGLTSCHVQNEAPEDGYGVIVYVSAPAGESFDFLRPDILPPKEVTV